MARILNKFIIIASGLALFSLSACSGGAKIAVAPAFEQAAPKIIALLPLQAPEGVRTERVQYITDCFKLELKNRGYLLLEDEVVRSYCSSAQCSERDAIAVKYGVDGFALVEIETLSRSNFLAGFVDILKGKLQMIDRSGVELLSISHTEQESGGLLLQSGQVLEGIKAQVRNYGDDGFNLLAEKFAKAIAVKLPIAPIKDGVDASQQIEIADVNLKLLKPSLYEICAEGSANVLVNVVLPGGTTAPLRSIAPGRYCGIYRLNATTITDHAHSFVEFRTAYGDVMRRALDMKLDRYCDLSKNITVQRMGQRTELRVEPPCAEGRVLLYRARAELGPYEKIAEVTGASWSGTSLGSEEKFQVLAVSRGGVPALPVMPQSES